MTPYYALCQDFKRAVLRHYLSLGTVGEAGRRLGIPRSYLCRLKRELGVEGPRAHQPQPREAR